MNRGSIVKAQQHLNHHHYTTIAGSCTTPPTTTRNNYNDDTTNHHDSSSSSPRGIVPVVVSSLLLDSKMEKDNKIRIRTTTKVSTCNNSTIPPTLSMRSSHHSTQHDLNNVAVVPLPSAMNRFQDDGKVTPTGRTTTTTRNIATTATTTICKPIVATVVTTKNGITDVSDLQFHKILGEGQFGQVWLASIQKTTTPTTTTHKGNLDTIMNQMDVKSTKHLDHGSKEETISCNLLLAVKIISKYDLIVSGGADEAIDQLRNEVRILRYLSSSRSRHPCLGTLVTTLQDTNLIYMVQEFYEGGELFTFVHDYHQKKRRRLQKQQQRQRIRNHTDSSHDAIDDDNDTKEDLHYYKMVQFYSACIADALDYLHRTCSIIYRDLKLENVMISQRTGYPVLIDFGYAKRINNNEHNNNNNKLDNSNLNVDTTTNDEMNNCDDINDENTDNDSCCSSSSSSSSCYSMVGTPKYMAPEIILCNPTSTGGGGYDSRVDLWSFGIVLYEMITGYNPMTGQPQHRSNNNNKDDDEEEDDLSSIDEAELFRCITEEEYVPVPAEIVLQAPLATNLISQLLIREPNERGIQRAQQLLQHEYYNTSIDSTKIRNQQLQPPPPPRSYLDLQSSQPIKSNTLSSISSGGGRDGRSGIPLEVETTHNKIRKGGTNHQTDTSCSLTTTTTTTIGTPHFENWDYIANNPKTCIFKDTYPKLTLKEQKLFQDI